MKQIRINYSPWIICDTKKSSSNLASNTRIPLTDREPFYRNWRKVRWEDSNILLWGGVCTSLTALRFVVPIPVIPSGLPSFRGFLLLPNYSLPSYNNDILVLHSIIRLAETTLLSRLQSETLLRSCLLPPVP